MQLHMVVYNDLVNRGRNPSCGGRCGRGVAPTRLERKDRGEWRVRQRLLKRIRTSLCLILVVQLLLLLASVMVCLRILCLTIVWHAAILAGKVRVSHRQARRQRRPVGADKDYLEAEVSGMVERSHSGETSDALRVYLACVMRRGRHRLRGVSFRGKCRCREFRGPLRSGRCACPLS